MYKLKLLKLSEFRFEFKLSLFKRVHYLPLMNSYTLKHLFINEKKYLKLKEKMCYKLQILLIRVIRYKQYTK